MSVEQNAENELVFTFCDETELKVKIESATKELIPLFENVTPTFADSGETGVFSGTIEFGDNFTVGAIYKVRWDGTEYIWPGHPDIWKSS